MTGVRMRLLLLLFVGVTLGCVADRPYWQYVILPEQQHIDYRDGSQLPPAPIPANQPPRTVANPRPETQVWNLSLDEAIRIALENANVVRVLAGTTAVSTGQTIYDAAIINTTIDQQNARFDPRLNDRLTRSTTDFPFGVLNSFDPTRAFITATPIDEWRNEFGLAQTNLLGGEASVNLVNDSTRTRNLLGPLALNPVDSSTLALNYTQPLLQGGGFAVNVAPILIARLNTEQSFFQYKNSVQEMVRGVIEAYWNLVQARVTVWARRIQLEQSEEQYKRELARKDVGLANIGDVSQAKVTFNQFKASLIAAEADVLNREAALRNILGLPPDDQRQIVPVSVPTNRRLPKNWDDVVRLAEMYRPDIVELKIILEADQVRMMQAQNLNQPRLDAFAQYRWNGISGEMPNGEQISSRAGQFADWTVGVNFSVPLGLRAERAAVRQQTLLIARDRVNLQQGLHAALHDLAATFRALDSSYEQYLALKETREAAYENLNKQIEEFRFRRVIFLNVLLAINDWGNAVTSEAQALLTYNVSLATLERQTGTILETHGLIFYEERFRAAGPLGACGPCREYPEATPITGYPNTYPPTPTPAENYFDLRRPDPREIKDEKIPAPPKPNVK